jgi:hypothetical protein
VERSHYETLGVEDGAAPEVVRRAYLELARELHPDRWTTADERARADVERRMQEVNEAWRVLGNPARRLAYDASRRRPPLRSARSAAARSVPFSSGDLFSVDTPPADAVTKLIRALPWLLVLLALGGIFVFTAYATSGSDRPVSCVRTDGSTAVSVPCEEPGAREVELRVQDASRCPGGTVPFQPVGEERALCLRR